MCKPEERSFIIDIWCSYILRGTVIASLSRSDVGAREADTKYRTSQFLIDKAEGPGPWQCADPLRCARPRLRTPFRCTGRLH